MNEEFIEQVKRVADQLEIANKLSILNLVNPLGFSDNDDLEPGLEILDNVIDEIITSVGYPERKRSMMEIRKYLTEKQNAQITKEE